MVAAISLFWIHRPWGWYRAHRRQALEEGQDDHGSIVQRLEAANLCSIRVPQCPASGVQPGRSVMAAPICIIRFHQPRCRTEEVQGGCPPP